MAKNKTTETLISVFDFIENLLDDSKKEACLSLIEIIKKEINHEPKMWGPSIVGFGNYHYKYSSGREGNSPLVGFSPRASAVTIYLSGSFENREQLLLQLGKHKTEKGCIYIKNLVDIDVDVLQNMIKNHIVHIQNLYPNE